MALIRGHNISVAFSAAPVLDKISFSIPAGTRTALVGRNGEGKSTLLKLIGGFIEPDSGELSRQSGLKTAYLQQVVPTQMTGTVYASVASGLSEAGELLAQHHELSSKFNMTEEDTHILQRIQDKIESVNAWSLGQQVDSVLSKMSLPADVPVSGLSGGMKRRVLLARALVTDPDILLLDEPTNHLDIGSISWLEKYLRGLSCSVVFVTHDRSFLDSVADSIIELDRGHLSEWPGKYEHYLKRKQEQLEVEAQHNALFDKKLAQEEIWIRQGIKARRTRNEGRVRALEALREQHRVRRNRGGTVSMNVNQADRSGKKVFTAKNIGFNYGQTEIVKNFSINVSRDDRLGIIGPNGCGKSTLINLLLGSLQPDTGTVDHGTNLEIAYFDQLRSSLDTHKSAADNVSEGTDSVVINGAPRHIMSYMKDFLFAPDRARAPITALSGGETARLLLAKLFLKPSNVLVLDEPSNDLDVETLELLEALLADYNGTVLLISHDRRLLDNVVTRSLVYQGDGKFVDVVGGYSDFLRELSNSSTLKPAFPTADTHIESAGGADLKNEASPQRSPTNKAVKLSYKLQRELDDLPETINRLEAEIEKVHVQISAPGFYDDQKQANLTVQQLEDMQIGLDKAYARWEELESMNSGG